MADRERYDKGMAVRTELLGKEFVERMNQKTYDDPVMVKFREAVAAH